MTLPASRCRARCGLFLPVRLACPVCGGPVEAEAAPEAGTLRAATRAGLDVVGVVSLGDAVVPAFVEGAAPGDRVRVSETPRGLLARRA